MKKEIEVKTWFQNLLSNATCTRYISDDGALYCHVFPGGAVFAAQSGVDTSAGPGAADQSAAHVTVAADATLALPASVIGHAGLSLTYSAAHHVMIAAFDGGATVAARIRLDSRTNRGAVIASCVVSEGGDEGGGGGPSGFMHWSEACAPPAPPLAGATPGPVDPPPPVFVATSARCDGGTVLVSLGGGDAGAQVLRGAGPTAAPPSAASDAAAAAAASSSFSTASAAVAATAAAAAAAAGPGPPVLGYAGYHPQAGLSLHSRVSLDMVSRTPYRLSSIEPCFDAQQ
jgi:hypothetical protein